jgi:hypothetical protein
MYLEIYAELVKRVFDRGMTLEPPHNPDGTVKPVADGILGGPHTLDGLLAASEVAGVQKRCATRRFCQSPGAPVGLTLQTTEVMSSR